jgi:hypothetical protein
MSASNANRRPSVSASDPPTLYVTTHPALTAPHAKLLTRFRSIPIPANTRGIPASSFGPLSPVATTGTSPLASYASYGTSPQGPGSHNRQRSTSSAAFGIARQLTAFLPADYPLDEEPEHEGPNGGSAKKQGKVKVLLLENINLDAANFLKNAGYEVGREVTNPRIRDSDEDAAESFLRSTTSPRRTARRSCCRSCQTTRPSVSAARPRSPRKSSMRTRK